MSNPTPSPDATSKAPLADAFDPHTDADTAPKADEPRRPDEVRQTIVANRAEARKLRSTAEHSHRREEEIDRDAVVAAALVREFEEDHRAALGRAEEQSGRIVEIENDLSRWWPDERAAAEKVEALSRVLGLEVPSDELMSLEPDASPRTPVVVETDPVRVEALQRELAQAQAEFTTLVDARRDLKVEKAALDDQRRGVSDEILVTERRWIEQKERAAALKDESEGFEGSGEGLLIIARDLTAEAEKLERELPEIDKVWAAHIEAHPERVPTDLGEIAVTVTDRERAEAHAQGRREEAADAEAEALVRERESSRANDAARSRSTLADIRDREATDISRRSETTTARVAELEAESRAEMALAEKLGDEADVMRADVERHRAAGRVETAETLGKRADALLTQSIDRGFRSTTVGAEAKALSESLAVDRGRIADLEKESASLRAEAVDLRAAAVHDVARARDLRSQAAALDRTATEIEVLLDTGEPFTVQVKAADGTTVELHADRPVPADADTDAPPADAGVEPAGVEPGGESPFEPAGVSFPGVEPTGVSFPGVEPAGVEPGGESPFEPAGVSFTGGGPVADPAPAADPKAEPADDGAAEVRSPHPIDHPDWLPPVWVAPERAIMDEHDMVEMRDKLRAGHDVVVGSDGHIRKSAEPVGPPMTEEAENFVESRLGEVRRLALEGIDTRISPDGSMAGAGRNSGFMYMAGPDRSFDEDEMNLIRSGILRGARVSVSPDGTVWMREFPNDPPRTEDESRAMLRTFEQQVETGEFQRHLDAGLTVSVIGDDIQTAVVDAALPPAIEFAEPGGPAPGTEPPEGPATDEVAPPSAADLQAEAERLTSEATLLRTEGQKVVSDEVVKAGLERDAVARQKWGAEQQANAADQQVKRELRLESEHRAVAEKAERAATALAGKGDEQGAAEKREEAQAARTLESTSSIRAASAGDEAVKLRQDAVDLGQKVTEFEKQIEVAEGRLSGIDQAADGREDRARLLSSASHNLAEAERLTKSAADLRAEGDVEAAQLVENAATHHQRLADSARAEADLVVLMPADVLDDPTASSLGRSALLTTDPGRNIVADASDTAPGTDDADPLVAAGFDAPDPAGGAEEPLDDLDAPGEPLVVAEGAEPDLDLDIDLDVGLDDDPLVEQGPPTAEPDSGLGDDLSPAGPLVAEAPAEPEEAPFDDPLG